MNYFSNIPPDPSQREPGWLVQGSEVTRHLLYFSRQWGQPTLETVVTDQMSFILLSCVHCPAFSLQHKQVMCDSHCSLACLLYHFSSLISGGWYFCCVGGGWGWVRSIYVWLAPGWHWDSLSAETCIHPPPSFTRLTGPCDIFNWWETTIISLNSFPCPADQRSQNF